MAQPKRFWRVAAAIFTAVNVGGAIFAVVNGEMMHAATHAVLLAGAFIVWRAVTDKSPRQEAAEVPQLDLHLDHLQQSIDAIALDVERIGEAQRFVAKLVQHEATDNLPADKAD